MGTTVFSRMRRLAALLLLAGLAQAGLSAKTVYVRCGLEDYTGHDGTSWEKALETIQEGINKATTSGDVVLVHAGLYDKGWGRGVPAEGQSYHWWGKSRIYINRTANDLTIRSCRSTAEEDVPDPEHTIIEGASDPDGEHGFGEEAVRCIQVETKPTATGHVIIEGFTLRGGRTKNRADAPGYGGALQCSQNGNDVCTNTVLVGCVITDCRGVKNPLSLGGTFVRCAFRGNTFVRTATTDNIYLSSDYSRYLNCLFTRNVLLDGTSLQPTNTACYFSNHSVFVNTTLADNRLYVWNVNTTLWYNTLVSCSRLPSNDGAVHTNRCDDSVSAAMLMAPTLGDFRPRTGTTAATAGEAAYVADETLVPLPSGIDRFRDIYGNAIASSGTIAAGCVQETATPAGGLLCATENRTYFDDSTNSYSEAYVWPSVYPTNYRVRAVVNMNYGKYETGNALATFFVQGGNVDNVRRVPSWDADDIYLAPPPATDSRRTVTAELAKKIAYARPGADAATADGSYDHPYATLQAAYENTSNEFTVIYAFPGVYDQGGTVWGANSQPVRLYLSGQSVGKRVVAMEGPEKTVLAGAPDPDTADGLGPKATMALAIDGSAGLAGFTVTRGYSAAATDSMAAGTRPIYSYGRDLAFADCIITNNHGGDYGVGPGRFERCLIRDNYGKNAILQSAIVISCVVEGNHLSASDGVLCRDNAADAGYWKYQCFNSTFIGDGTHNVWSTLSGYSIRVNCIGEGSGGGACATLGLSQGNVYHGFATVSGTAGNLVADPMLTAGYRPFSRSPAVAAGVKPLAAAGQIWEFAQEDFYGKPFRYDAAGRAVCGAVQDLTAGGVYLGGGAGVALTGASEGFTAAAQFTGATVAAAAGASRPFAGVLVNGVTNAFDETHTTYQVSSEQVAAGDVAVVPYYSADWYVDAVNGSDAENFGYHAGNAFKTLARALTNGFLAANDRVVALPGTYDKGTVSNATTIVPARAYVKAGVALVSRDGAAVTFIKGEASSTPAYAASASYTPEQLAGLGVDAVRGVYLESGARVRGFTVTNGFTYGFGATGEKEHGGYRCNGGNVAGAGTAEDCVITGGKAFRGGGAFISTAIRCIFDGNAGLYGGGASSDALHYGCLSRNNTNAGNSNWGGFFYWRACENCTVLDSLGGPGKNTYFLRHALVLGNMGDWDHIPDEDTYHAGDGHLFTNCVVALTGAGCMTVARYRTCFLAGANCILTNLDALVVDDEARPVIGRNVAIDFGDAAVAPELTETDLSGVQRIYNGALDCGALEADWRATYAHDLGARWCVSSASSNVVETASSALRIVDGATLSAALAHPFANAKRRDLTIEAGVTGTGVLSVFIRGEKVGEIASGATELTLRAVDPTALTLDFSYAGEGFADVARAYFRTGLCINCR